MGQKFREPANRQQVSLLPRSIDEYVGEGDLVRYLDVLVDEFDISLIESEYSVRGRHAYSPRVLLKILFYGKLRGVRSSRELARACQENLRFIFLAGHEQPDFRTISDFRKRHQGVLSELLKQTIQIGLEQGMIKLEHVAIDGTKVKANASRKSFRSPEELEKLLSSISKKLEESFIEDIERDEREDEELGDMGYDSELPEDLQDLKELQKKVRSAVREYKSTLMDTKRPKQVSSTDPESRFIKGEGIVPSYNCLAAVDGGSHMVVGGYVTNAVSDNAQLKPCLEQVEENTGKNPKAITADKGFRAHEGLVELKKRSIDGYVTPPDESKKKFTREDFIYNAQDDTYTCPNGRLLQKKSRVQGDNIFYNCYSTIEDCSDCPLQNQCMQRKGKHRTLNVSVHHELVDEMREKTSSETGKLMARKRAATVETVFGNIKGNKKLRQFLFRGMNMINAMWRFELAAHNLEKLIRFAQKQQIQLKPT